MTGLDVALAAKALVGTPFRLRGRNPATGLDCVGLVSEALGAPAPSGYHLRNRDISAALAFVPGAGLVDACGPLQPGDVLLVRTGHAQHHLLIAGSDGGFIHAHAGLRRVVETPVLPPWPIERLWRLKD